MTDLTARLLDLAIAIQQIPAPTFHERQRAEFVHRQFLKEELSDVEIDATGNVYARLPGPSTSLPGLAASPSWPTGQGAGRAAPFGAAPWPGRQPVLADRPGGRQGNPLVVSAHLDTVFPENTELRVFREEGRISGPGIGDNAIGVAGLLGLVWALRERGLPLAGDLWLVADVCEEGLGDLRGMQAVVDRFGDGPRAYLVLEGMALGQVYHRALGVRRYRISIKTAGGHSWADYGQPSAIHELTSLAAQITSLELPAEPRTTLNVGKINGGTSVNTIAARATLELDLRSESPQILLGVSRQVEALARGMERAGVAVGVEIIGQRLAGEIPAGHPLVQAAQECLRKQGVQPNLTIGSTDANIPLSRGYPAVAIGLTSGSGAHTLHEYINIKPLEQGMEQLVGLVRRLGEESNQLPVSNRQ
ncbi:MAG: M20/M25/M40 family metallo-hydrolase [Anaerolineales bacterium]|nr:M20/M25/M40 family metallo-hydrolase [Anaerolineales bacterium]